MSNQSGYGRIATAMRSSTVHRCPVCGADYSSLFSVQRHLGVKHMLDATGRMITKERQAYLRHQSDRRYVRNAERKSDSQYVKTETELTKPQLQALSAAGASYIEPARQSQKLILVEPVILHKIFNKVKSMNYLKSNQRTSEEEDGDDDLETNSAVSPVCVQSQRRVQTSIRVRRQPQKTILSSTLDWSCY